jgi:hypothetical protein
VILSSICSTDLSMRALRKFSVLPMALFWILSAASAQRHDAGSSPPTAPPPKQIAPTLPAAPPPNPLGSLEFSTVNDGVPAPEALAAELQSSDDRIRTSALASLGAPAQYLTAGHVPFPHSVHLEFVALSNTAQLDAILTVELDQHLISAILVPEDGEWQRIANMLYRTPFSDLSVTPSTFLRADRSLVDHQHYSAIFHAITNGPEGNLTENEVYLRIINRKPVITISFASTERSCDPTHQKPCDFIERWLQPDPSDTDNRFFLVTATGHVKLSDSHDPIAHAEPFEAAHLRNFTCQPFAFSDADLKFESTADPVPCAAPHDSSHEQPLH